MSRETFIQQSHGITSEGVRNFDVDRRWNFCESVCPVDVMFATIHRTGRELSIDRQICIAFLQTFRNSAQYGRIYHHPVLWCSVSVPIAHGRDGKRLGHGFLELIMTRAVL
jgi:hypothetical protein